MCEIELVSLAPATLTNGPRPCLRLYLRHHTRFPLFLSTILTSTMFISNRRF